MRIENAMFEKKFEIPVVAAMDRRNRCPPT
jgi:hypothetical protein